MGKIVVTEFVSLDGVMEAPGGEPGYKHTNWVGKHPDTGQFKYKFDEIVGHDAHLLGRVTYESFAGAWPQREGAFADRVNTMPKFVVSNTLENPEWPNTTVLKGDVAQSVTKLRNEYNGSLLVAGSWTLVQALKDLDLVDEYHLMVFPIVLGSGRKVFESSDDTTALKLADVQRFESVLLLSYQRERDGADTSG